MKQNNWEKDFEERFIELHPKMDCTKPTPVWDCNSLKSFIASQKELSYKEGYQQGYQDKAQNKLRNQ